MKKTAAAVILSVFLMVPGYGFAQADPCCDDPACKCTQEQCRQGQCSCSAGCCKDGCKAASCQDKDAVCGMKSDGRKGCPCQSPAVK